MKKSVKRPNVSRDSHIRRREGIKQERMWTAEPDKNKGQTDHTVGVHRDLNSERQRE